MVTRNEFEKIVKKLILKVLLISKYIGKKNRSTQTNHTFGSLLRKQKHDDLLDDKNSVLLQSMVFT
jgi:hypothetical protein